MVIGVWEWDQNSRQNWSGCSSAGGFVAWASVSKRMWSQVNEQGSGQATRVQVAGLWIAACSLALALALFRTVFDVLEVMGR
jgi:hypothetical protein